MTYRDEGIVFKKKDTGEADQVLHILTREHGKVIAVARGIKRIASRKGGNADLFTHGKFSFAQGKGLDILVQAESIDTFSHLKEDIHSISDLFYMAELIDKFTVPEDEDEHVYTLYLSVLKFMEQGLDRTLLLRYFELRLLAYTGYGLDMHCALCGKPIREGEDVVMTERGLLHKKRCVIESAPTHYRYRMTLTTDDLKVIRFLLTSPISEIFRLRHVEKSLNTIKVLTKNIIQDTISSKIVSYDFFHIDNG